jgi:hypothetical protein
MSLEFFDYKPIEKLTSLDDLYEKFNMGYYHSLESLERDLCELVEKTKKTRCKNELALKYLDYFMSTATMYLRRKQTDFLSKWRVYYESRLQ